MLVAITALASVGFPAFPTVAQGVLTPTDPMVPMDRTVGTPTNRTLWMHANQACDTHECSTSDEKAVVVDEDGNVWALGESATRVGTINDDDDDDDVLVLFALSVLFWFWFIYWICILISSLLLWDAAPRIIRSGTTFLGSFVVLFVFFRVDNLLFSSIFGIPTHWHYAPHSLTYFNLRWLLSLILAIFLFLPVRFAHFMVYNDESDLMNERLDEVPKKKIKVAVTEEEPPSWV